MRKENYQINSGFVPGRNSLFWFILLFAALITTFCKTEVEDDAKWQHEILQRKENSDLLYLSLTVGESGLLFAFP